MTIMSKSKVTIFVAILMTVTSKDLVQDCTKKGTVFVAEPRDIEIECGADETVTFACQYKKNIADYDHLQWIINSVDYNSTQLPSHHSYDGRILAVRNIKLGQQNSTYQCQLLSKVNDCAYRSTVGRLIIKCQAFDVQCLPSYHFQSPTGNGNSLKKIVSTITQEVEGYTTLYKILYTDFHSGKLCALAIINSSSCTDGTCTSVFNTLASSCPSDSDISVVVSNDRGYSNQNPIVIGAVNDLFEVSFTKKVASMVIKLKFINQPKESEKWYTIRHGPANLGCTKLPSITKGHLSNSVFISVELSHNNLIEDITKFDICFEIIVHSGNKTVKMEGTYNFEVTGTDPTVILVVAGIMCGMAVCVSMTLVYVTLCYFVRRSKDLTEEDIEKIRDTRHHSKKQDVQDALEPIDLSTTYYWKDTTTEEGSLYEFAEVKQKQKPRDSFGYVKLDTDKKLEKATKKRLILMEEGIPKYYTNSASSAIIQRLKGKEVYIQKKLGKEVAVGTSFLYCARSKDITAKAYWTFFDVNEACEESLFLKQKMPGFKAGWIRHGYFQLTKPEHIKYHQRVIILKKDYTLVTGYGIRHLLDLDGSKTTTNPVQNREEWKHIFVQSNEDDRKLIPGTKYLFCAMMEKIDSAVYRSVHNVTQPCNMEEFGREHSSAYKQANGYGYFEFKGQECLETHLNVIVMDKNGKLFTGAGAKFFYTGHEYSDNKVSKTEVSPPSLDNTRWKHVFIQSRSKKRTLQKGTTFLYCEYDYSIEYAVDDESK